jgi:anti-sigma factor RsiW
MKPETTNGISDELLQRYFDGELSPNERAQVEARLDGDARLKLDALGEMRVLFRAELSPETPALDFSSTFDAISHAPIVASVPAARRRRFLPMSAAGGLMAAAAALFLFLRPVAPTMNVQNAASVEMLEAEGTLASVFQIENGGEHATVIWNDATPSSQGEVP